MLGAADIDSLTTLVQRMVEEAGDTAGFDAHLWLQEWMSQPLPALNNRCPKDVLGELGGFDLVQSTLLRIRAGAFS